MCYIIAVSYTHLKAAVKLKGEKLAHSDMHVTEVALSVKDIHRKARSYGVSITVLDVYKRQEHY